MDLVRSLVSKQKRRWEADGFNLDLTYITDSIIAMGFPSEGTEGLFRNPLAEVQRFLRERHGDSFHVYNLCIERSYKPEKFSGRVSVYPFADHNAPTLAMIRSFCEDVDAWFKKDVRNVAAIHCKAGKGRTGTMICCYLLYCGAIKSADDVLEFYGVRRTHNGHGVTIPSQRRYVRYFAETVAPGWDSARERLVWSLRRINISALPKNEHGEPLTEWKPLFGVTRKDKTLLYVARDEQSIESNLIPSFQCDGLVVQGDIKFELFNGKSTKRLLWFWLNTSFITPGQCSITLTKPEIDGICKDKEHKLFPADFTVTIWFERVLGRARNKGSRAPPINPALLSNPSIPSSSSPTFVYPSQNGHSSPTATTKLVINELSPPSLTQPPHTIASPKPALAIDNITLTDFSQGSTSPLDDSSTLQSSGEKSLSSLQTVPTSEVVASPTLTWATTTPSIALPAPGRSTSPELFETSSFFASFHQESAPSAWGGLDKAISSLPPISSLPASLLTTGGSSGTLLCDVCRLPLVNGSQTVQSNGRNFHWACATCSVCSEPLANRASCTITDTTTIERALICSNCDTFWVRCPHCKRSLQDGNRLVNVPDIGKRCKHCFCCSLCQLPFKLPATATSGTTDGDKSGNAFYDFEDDDDDAVDAYDVVLSSLICRSHSGSSRKIFIEKRSRPRSVRIGGASTGGLTSVSEPSASNPVPSNSGPTNAQSTSLTTSRSPNPIFSSVPPVSTASVSSNQANTASPSWQPVGVTSLSTSPPTHRSGISIAARAPRPSVVKLVDEKKLSLRKLRGLALEMPRCGLCHGLIDVNCESIFVEQLQKSFHEEHFKCASCSNVILRGELYHVLGGDGVVHCNDCYSKSSSCFRCHLPLLGSHLQIAPEIYVHIDCFNCESCNAHIQGGSFIEIGQSIFCSSCGLNEPSDTPSQDS